MPLPSDSVVIPVTIVSGYLGSGKTTLINWLLNKAENQRLAVLVNDFGDLAIDAKLIESQAADVISLSGGCVCCSYGNDLTATLLDLDPNKFDQVVIEASGVALPGAIAATLSLIESYIVSAIVVLADAVTIEKYSSDKFIADTIDRQLAVADLIALNKIDVVNTDDQLRIQAWLARTYPTVRVVTTINSELPVSALVHDSYSASNASGLYEEGASHSVSGYLTFTLDMDGHYDVRSVARSLTQMSRGLLRVKGFIRDLNGEMQTLQIVGSRWSLHSAPNNVSSGLTCIGLKGLCSESQVRAGLE